MQCASDRHNAAAGRRKAAPETYWHVRKPDALQQFNAFHEPALSSVYSAAGSCRCCMGWELGSNETDGGNDRFNAELKFLVLFNA